MSDFSSYFGQFFDGKQVGFGQIFYKDGSSYAGFFNGERRHGIGILTKMTNNIKEIIYQVHDDNHVEVMTRNEVREIDNGTVTRPEMNLFFKDDLCARAMKYFGYEDPKEMTFEFIKTKGDQIVVFVEDLEEIARWNNLHKHELPSDIDKKSKELLEDPKDKQKQVMTTYRKTDQHFEQNISDEDQLERYLANREKMNVQKAQN